MAKETVPNRRYTDEFKLEALRLAQSVGLNQAAKRLGMPSSSLGNRHIVETMNAAGYAIDHLHLTGGHVANRVLVQLYADTANCRVVLPHEAEGVLLGTGVVAAAAAGLHPSLEAAGRAMVRAGEVVEPDSRQREFFERRYRAFLLMIDQREALRRVS